MDGVIILFGVWLIGQALDKVPRAIKEAEKKLQDTGARIYETTHGTSYNDDLPLAKGRLTKSKLINLARSVGFPDPEVAAAVAMAESGGLINALGDFKNGQHTSIGLWQIHLPAHPEYTREEMVNPLLNARAALKIRQSPRGWKHWSTYNTGAYKKFL